MKIRIKGNSLRYRLTKSDVSRFESESYLEEKTEFPGQSLNYVLKKTKAGQLSASFEGTTIILNMPESFLQEWTSTDVVGFENYDGKLFLLVEKDFTCMDNVAEDQSDNYPNPLVLKSL